mmetsp:Transcript_1732/g.4204  ORF Transcript_1732/g.4204 Transcript_1732/m.4204 type:complete len:121 (-) Transcript_1732:7-369(-)
MPAGCQRRPSTCTGVGEGTGLPLGSVHLELLRWARAHGCPWHKWTCTEAAAGGHLQVLQWARAHGCPWDEETCAEAAKGGHLAVLQWAKGQGCPWDARQCLEVALETGHRAVVRWVQRNM